MTALDGAYRTLETGFKGTIHNLKMINVSIVKLRY